MQDYIIRLSRKIIHNLLWPYLVMRWKLSASKLIMSYEQLEALNVAYHQVTPIGNLLRGRLYNASNNPLH